MREGTPEAGPDPAPPPARPPRCRPRPGSPGTTGSGQRARLIDALVAVVAENGYLRTTVGQVAATAGVPENAFHTHFRDLDECFLAAYRRGTEVLLTTVEAAYRAEPSWPAGIRAGLRVVLELVAAEPAFARTCLIEASVAGARVHRARLAFLAKFRSYLSGPDVPRVPDVIRDAVIGGVYTMIYNYVESDRAAELPGLLDPLTDFTLMFFRG
ncbi:TetR/AcrR family transcriptional regulator [Actinoallomurus sp. CA-150999]|uniref:TetR/AcrR family transcriptional regulator n=1 Tax=Actinoallomurus sp. CA-150999 TaxID=3239887 RepID=UPI003D8DB754